MAEREGFVSRLFGSIVARRLGKASKPSPANSGNGGWKSSTIPTQTNSKVRPINRMVVERSFISLLNKRNWKKKGRDYNGYYRTPYGAYKGYITRPYDGTAEFIIVNPPECLQLHSKRCCFLPKMKGLVYVHFSSPPKTLDAGIMAIEKILTESHEIELRPGGRSQRVA